MIKMKGKKVLINIARAAVCAGAAALGFYLLWRYEYITQAPQIDNIVGAIPIALVILAVAGTCLLAWIKYDKKRAALAVATAVITALSAALFPNALRGDWWIKSPYDTRGDSPDITAYQPFKEGNKTAKLDEVSALKLSGDFPVMDGALALYPVYAAIAETVYDESAFTPESVAFTNTLRAYEAIIAGERDVIFVASASAKQREAAEKAGAELVFTPIGKEAFVFLAGAENPLDGLSYTQIRNIYSGKTAKWRTLGWKDGGDIIAFQRPEGSGSQTGLQSVMGDMPVVSPQPLPDKSLAGSNSLMKQISVRYKGVQPALGYSYRYFANTMFPNPEAKMLKINGVAPSAENIANGSYPFTVNFYAVTNGKPEGNTKLLIDWILSPQGQRLIEKCGYSPLN